MKYLIVLSALFITGAGLYSQQVSLWDYKPPVSQESNLNINFLYNYQDNNAKSVKDIGKLDINYLKFYSSLPYEWSFKISSQNSYNENYTKFRNQYTYFENDLGNFKTYTDIRFHIKKFITEKSNFFLNSSINTEIASFKYFDSLNLYVPINIGIGYGRFYSATNFSRALRADEFLKSEEITNENFNTETLVSIAEHLDKSAEYYYKYNEKSDEEWWKDLELLLLKSGKLIEGRLSPYSIYRLNQALSERFYPRLIGWDVSINMQFNLQSLVEHTFELKEYVEKSIGVNLGFNFGYPISNLLHLSHSTEYTYTIDYENIMLHGNRQIHEINSNLNLSYEVTSLIDFLIAYTYSTKKVNLSNSYVFNDRHYLLLEMYYYLENNIALSLSSSINVQKNYADIFKVLDRTNRIINFSLYYRFF